MAYEAWRVWMDMPILAYDPVNRTETATWGNMPQGVPWGQSGGVPANYNVTPGWATLVQTTAGAPRFSLIDTGVDVLDVSTETAVDQVATGDILTSAVGMAPTVAGIVDNLMMARLQLRTDNTVVLEVIKRVNVTQTTLATITLTSTYQAGTVFGIRLQRSPDGTVRAKAWPATTSEPQAWLAVATDTSLPYLPVAFCRGSTGAANTNVNPTIMFRKILFQTTERRVDITQYVDTVQTPMNTSSGSTAETSGDTGSATITVNNARQWFTPENPVSPFGPNITAGRRIWIEEVIGYQKVGDFSGYLEFPEIDTWTQSSDDAPRDQMLTLSVVDELARQSNTEPFVSTLAGHIRYNGGEDLRAYYPLGDSPSSQTAANYAPFARPLMRIYSQTPGGGTPTATPGGNLIQYGAGLSLPGDDISTAMSNPVVSGTAISRASYGVAAFSDPIQQNSGETIAFTYWCQVDSVTDTVVPATIRNNDDITLQQDMLLYYLLGSGWTARWHPPGSTITEIIVPGPAAFKPVLVTLRLTLPSGLCELWIDDHDSVTTTLLGSIPSSTSWSSIAAGSHVGSVGHVQVHVGPAAFPRTMHLAQYRAGLLGLDGQLTGERVRTILRYAGIPDGELGDVDSGTVVMQNASLAGMTPAEALRVAEATEQGLLMASGAGRVTFADRRRLYNI